MTIAFRNIPAGVRVPLFYAEVDNSKANSAQAGGRTLIIGQMTQGGDAAPNLPIQSLSPADAKSRFGLGSMLALMVDWYRKRDQFGEVHCLPLADDVAAIAAAGSITFTGPATAPGWLSLYVGGALVATQVSAGMTAAQIAAAVAAALTADSNLPVTAAVDGQTAGKVNLTAKNKGMAGNEIDLRFNYRGLASGEALPAGVTAAITAMVGGATNPTLTAALASLGDEPFDFIVCPYTDAASLNALQALLSDVGGRWSWSAQQYGHVFAAHRGTVAARTTFGLTRNDQHASVIGFYDSPTPAWLWAANFAAAAAVSLRVDSAMPLQTLALDVLAPPVASRDTLAQRNVLLFDGITTHTVDPDGTVRIENGITTYRTNAFGQADDSYLQIETLFTLVAVLRRLRGVITSKYSRVKLADNGTRIPPGAAAVTPNTIKADIIAMYQEMEGDLVENAALFAANLVVERDPANRRRLNVLLPPDIINSLGVLATLVQFQA